MTKADVAVSYISLKIVTSNDFCNDGIPSDRGGAIANEGCASEHPSSESYTVPTRKIYDIFNIYLGLHTLE